MSVSGCRVQRASVNTTLGIDILTMRGDEVLGTKST